MHDELGKPRCPESKLLWWYAQTLLSNHAWSCKTEHACTDLVDNGDVRVAQPHKPIGLLPKDLPCFLGLAPKHDWHAPTGQLQLVLDDQPRAAAGFLCSTQVSISATWSEMGRRDASQVTIRHSLLLADVRCCKVDKASHDCSILFADIKSLAAKISLMALVRGCRLQKRSGETCSEHDSGSTRQQYSNHKADLRICSNQLQVKLIRHQGL